MKNIQPFNLPATHVFQRKIVSASGTVPQVASNNGGFNQSSHPINGGTAPALVGGLHHIATAVLASQYAVQKKSVYEHHNNSVSDIELFSFISNLQKAYNLS